MPENTNNAAPVIVIGGGISGLACAWRLKQRGVPVLLLECGPQSFMLTPPLAELIDSVGLTRDIQKATPRAPRYILKNGKLVAAPLSPLSLFGTPLMDVETKWRLLTEPLRRSHPPDEDIGRAS